MLFCDFPGPTPFASPSPLLSSLSHILCDPSAHSDAQTPSTQRVERIIERADSPSRNTEIPPEPAAQRSHQSQPHRANRHHTCTYSVLVLGAVILGRYDETASFSRAPIDGLNNVDELLRVLDGPVDLVVVPCAQVDHYVLVPIEEHHCHRVVQLVHLIEIWHLRYIHLHPEEILYKDQFIKAWLMFSKL